MYANCKTPQVERTAYNLQNIIGFALPWARALRSELKRNKFLLLDWLSPTLSQWEGSIKHTNKKFIPFLMPGLQIGSSAFLSYFKAVYGVKFHFMLMNYHFSIQILSEPGLSKVFLCYASRIPASNPMQRTHKDFLCEFYLFIE